MIHNEISQFDSLYYHNLLWQNKQNYKEILVADRSHEKFFFLSLQLLDKKKRATVADMSESMECLCYLMRTVGPILDIPKAKVYIDSICSSCYLD